MLLLRALTIFLAFLSFGASELRFSEEMAPGFVYKWDYDNENLTMQVTAPTVGWVGIGFSETKEMANADIIMMGVANGEPFAWDYFALYNGQPVRDFDQNVTVLYGAVNGTHTTVKVTRLLTSTGESDNEIKTGVNNVIWAYGTSDPNDGQNHYHEQNRGHKPMILLQKKSMITETSVSTSIVTTEKFKSSTTTTPQNEPDDKYDHEFPHSAALDFEQTVILRWNFDETTITLQLTAPTTGWIGLGFSNTGSMRGADLIIMGKTLESEYAVDTHSETNGVPDVDDKQDVSVLSAWENGTHTSITVTRKRVTCDKDDMAIKEGTYRVIWAFGADDLPGNTPEGYDYHDVNRGAKSLKLINSFTKKIGKETETEILKEFDVRPINIKIPAEDTFYLCKVLEVPEATKEQHIIGFEPYLTPGNEKNVHHIVIYLCNDGIKDEIVVGRNYQCYVEVNPGAAGCKLITGWAIGMSGIRYPTDTGLPVGGTEHPRYVLLETHYDNPKLEEFQDSSGIRFHLTENLRKIEVGVLSMSRSLNSIWIPPNMDKFRVNGYCSDICISRGMEESQATELNVFAVGLHSHVAGRAMKLRHYRKGLELEPLAKDDHYDFDYQEMQYLDGKKAKIMNGDGLTVQCDYSTLGKTNITTGGLGTRNEMCVAYIFYYPAITLSHCNSRPKFLEDVNGFNGLAAVLNVTISREEATTIPVRIRRRPIEAMDAISPVLNRVEWTYEKKEFSESYSDTLKQLPYCATGKTTLMGFMEEFPVPKFDKYVEEDECEAEKPEEETTRSSELAAFTAVSVIALIIILAKVTQS